MMSGGLWCRRDMFALLQHDVGDFQNRGLAHCLGSFLVTVEASKSGYRTAKTDVKAAQDPTAVQLVLRKRSAVAPTVPDDDGLKLPDAFAPSRRGR